MRRAVQFACLAAATVSVLSCGPKGLANITLPSGPGTPAPDYATAFAAALIKCHDIRTLSAELSLAGHAGRQTLRGRALIGLAAGAMRLEALAPGGTPAFIFVADGSRGRLLLARDRRVLDGAPPADILEALVGVGLDPQDLRAMLAGCLRASPEATGARAYGTEWVVVDLAGGGSMYLRRGPDGGFRITAGTYANLRVQYGVLGLTGTPSSIRLTSIASPRGPALDLTLALSQVEVNGELPHEQLVALTVPPGTAPITLQELRESYHR
jgi:hypothetical protein